MKNLTRHLLFFLPAILMAGLQAQALTIVSDLDDTIKITRVNTAQAAYTAILKTDVFMGMDELMRAFKAPKTDNRLVIVSGSPGWLRRQVNNLLTENKIPADELHLVDDTENKRQKLLEIAAQNKDGLVLLGDDQEFDPDFYQEIKRKYPKKVKAIYIHQVNGRELPSGQVGFVSAYEVALNEAQDGRIASTAPEQIRNGIEERLNAVINDPYIFKRVSLQLVPGWQKCAQDLTEFNLMQASQLAGADLRFLARLSIIVSLNCAK